jgi:uncharacterized protein (TIGR00296 family)
MLDEMEGELAVKFARSVIESTVRTGSYDSNRIQLPPTFETKAGAFVTILEFPSRALRGCIGFTEPVYPLKLAILNAAVESAISDPRFEPVRESELQSVLVEVSILSKPEPIRVKSPWEIPGRIKVGKHGLMVERGRFRGLLLPQVAVDEGWDSEEFVAQTCWKAGLPDDAWKDPKITVYTFEAEIFSEIEPGGAVRRRKTG